MTDWDSFTACVATREERLADVLRTEGLRIYQDNKPEALAAMKALVAWWHKLDVVITGALAWAAGKLGPEALKKITAWIVSSAGIAAAGRLAGLLAVLAAGFALGSVVVASADCLADA